MLCLTNIDIYHWNMTETFKNCHCLYTKIFEKTYTCLVLLPPFYKPPSKKTVNIHIYVQSNCATIYFHHSIPISQCNAFKNDPQPV